MHLELDTRLPCSLEQAVAEVKQPRLLFHIARPMVYFAPCDGTVIPEQWRERTYWFQLKLLGILPFGKQAVRISFQERPGCFTVRDNGFSALIRKWDHRITITENNGEVIYRDQLELDAGILTPFVWVFARVFYGHRQSRWRKLAQSGFDYANA